MNDRFCVSYFFPGHKAKPETTIMTSTSFLMILPAIAAVWSVINHQRPVRLEADRVGDIEAKLLAELEAARDDKASLNREDDGEKTKEAHPFEGAIQMAYDEWAAKNKHPTSDKLITQEDLNTHVGAFFDATDGWPKEQSAADQDKEAPGAKLLAKAEIMEQDKETTTSDKLITQEAPQRIVEKYENFKIGYLKNLFENPSEGAKLLEMAYDEWAAKNKHPTSDKLITQEDVNTHVGAFFDATDGWPKEQSDDAEEGQDSDDSSDSSDDSASDSAQNRREKTKRTPPEFPPPPHRLGRLGGTFLLHQHTPVRPHFIAPNNFSFGRGESTRRFRRDNTGRPLLRSHATIPEKLAKAREEAKFM